MISPVGEHVTSCYGCQGNEINLHFINLETQLTYLGVGAKMLSSFMMHNVPGWFQRPSLVSAGYTCHYDFQALELPPWQCGTIVHVAWYQSDQLEHWKMYRWGRSVVCAQPSLRPSKLDTALIYTSDAADDLTRHKLGERRVSKDTTNKKQTR